VTLAARLPSHRLLGDLYSAAVRAVAPGPALSARLGALTLDPRVGVHLVALGKAALPMATAAVEALRGWGREPAGGVIVAPEYGQPPHSSLPLVVGDHPEPGPCSLAAAAALEAAARRVAPDNEAWVLLSGGTTSLVGAPEVGISPADLSELYRLLLGSGLDIEAMNRIRKRFSRWGGGRLASALAPARVRVFVVSDVIGDDLASIGSGPCVPDPSTALEVRRSLEKARLWNRIPAATRHLVEAAQAGKTPETPKPGDPAFARVTVELVASNRLALEAAARRAAELRLAPIVSAAPLAGEASTAGASVAAMLLQHCGRPEFPQPCLIWGGETTVTLGAGVGSGLGGRCQELALAAARALSAATGSEGAAILAAGTDGRDGPTDAAGAIVDRDTWTAIAAAGRNPAHDLAVHDAYHALDAAGALLRPGLTGTNVMDVAFGICDPPAGQR